MTQINPQKALVEELTKLAPLHFVGVNGSGMRPLAEFTAALNCEVTGSDRSQVFRDSMIQFAIEGSLEDQRLIARSKTIIFSSAILSNHPTLEQAKISGKTTLHRSLLLSRLTAAFKTIAVAGTHGKSTTSALIAHGLTSLGLDPSWIIGAPFADGKPSFHRGSNDLLVIEADESDGTFVHYSPYIGVINNIEPDHMDFYQTVGRLEEAFGLYASNIASTGALGYLHDSPAISRSISKFGGKRLGFGETPGSDLMLRSIIPLGLHTKATFSFNGTDYLLNLPLPGKHNVLNGLSALTVMILLGVAPDKACLSLEAFPGVERRLQRYPSTSGALIFDDYAHNPGKIRGLLAGISDAYPDRRVIAVFQPHRYSRISSLYGEFITAFKGGAHVVVTLPVYSAGEAAVAGFEADGLARDISTGSGVKTFFAATLKEAADLVKCFIDINNDIVVTIGAGDVWLVAKDLADSR